MIPSSQNATSTQMLTIADILNRKHVAHLNGRYFEVDTGTDKKTVWVKVIFRNADASYFYPVEARTTTEDQDLTNSAARELLIDYVDAYFDEFLSNGEDTYLPIDWADYECDGIDLQMKGQILNQRLDTMADELLNSLS